MKQVKTLEWDGETLRLIDQRKLPLVLETVICCSHEDVARAIKSMVVRGAPAIGAAAAYGVALAAIAAQRSGADAPTFRRALGDALDLLASTRPTAVNLFWALDRMRELLVSGEAAESLETLVGKIVAEAGNIAREDAEACRKLGEWGASLVQEGDSILTHCNAGALATVDYGTALGVIRAAHRAGKHIRVFADETRPFLQGARLTAWECIEEGIPVTLICDNMAGYVMKKGMVQLVMVGADRIARNGDVANKIGTYSVAVLAREHKVPFYVAAPTSTVDLKLRDGDAIPIEQRDGSEVTHFAGTRIAPPGVDVLNPAFDVTPASFVSAIVTESGIVRPPYEQTLGALVRKGRKPAI